jgi:hypothetical protein
MLIKNQTSSKPLYRIRDILRRIRNRILGFVYWITDLDPGPEPALFVIGIRNAQKIKVFLTKAFLPFILLTWILVEELPVAPLGPLRQCQCPLSLHASILYTILLSI